MLLTKGNTNHLQPAANRLYGLVIHALAEDIGMSEPEILEWLNQQVNLPSLKERADCAMLASERANSFKQLFQSLSHDILDAAGCAVQHNTGALIMLMGVFGVIFDQLVTNA